MILKKYCEYLESYLKSFYTLYNEKNRAECFYSIGLLYSNFMELWIKFCIMNYDGSIENWTIKEFNIGNHNFYLQLKDEQTIHEFMSLGVKKQDYDELLRSIEKIRKATSHDELSYAFRYPTDKVNNIYIFELESSKKEEIIENMKKSIEISCKILNDHIEGVSRDLTRKRNVLKEFIDKYQNN